MFGLCGIGGLAMPYGLTCIVLAVGCGARSTREIRPEAGSAFDAGASGDGGVPDGRSGDWHPSVLPTCPSYPGGPYGWREGETASDLSLPGNDPGDGTWSMGDFWCAANVDRLRPTVLVLILPHSETSGPGSRFWWSHTLEEWEDAYADRGLAGLLVSIYDSKDGARSYWDGEPGYSLRWAADPTFATARFFDGPTVGLPAFVVIDLATMEIAEIRQGSTGSDEDLFLRFLR